MENKLRKICFKCNKEKNIGEFYRHKQMSDGHLNKCKTCTKRDVKERKKYLKNDTSWVLRERERCRKKNKPYHTFKKLYPHLIAKKAIYGKRRDIKYPEKYKASIINQRNPLKESGYELHHWSYNEPHYLDVIKLTVKEHNKAHRFLVYDQERFMYSRYDTNEILDTKEKHERFIRWCIENKED